MKFLVFCLVFHFFIGLAHCEEATTVENDDDGPTPEPATEPPTDPPTDPPTPPPTKPPTAPPPTLPPKTVAPQAPADPPTDPPTDPPSTPAPTISRPSETKKNDKSGKEEEGIDCGETHICIDEEQLFGRASQNSWNFMALVIFFFLV